MSLWRTNDVRFNSHARSVESRADTPAASSRTCVVAQAPCVVRCGDPELNSAPSSPSDPGGKRLLTLSPFNFRFRASTQCRLLARPRHEPSRRWAVVRRTCSRAALVSSSRGGSLLYSRRKSSRPWSSGTTRSTKSSRPPERYGNMTLSGLERLRSQSSYSTMARAGARRSRGGRSAGYASAPRCRSGWTRPGGCEPPDASGRAIKPSGCPEPSRRSPPVSASPASATRCS